ncbi:MAG: hypothetical protein HUJ26_18995 [Planctomycetaceae bacterium]|nr:hypothetical protein [Planctomycetaceae bacterium]
MPLNFEQLKSKSLSRRKTVTIEGVGEILVKPLSAKQTKDFAKAGKEELAKGEEIDNTFGLKVIVQAAIDEDGGQLFQDEDQVLEVLTIDDIPHIVEEILQFSGVDKAKVKNSESPTSDD